MDATRWTRPEAYSPPEGRLPAAIARREARRARRMVEDVSALLARAARATRSPTVRSALAAAAGRLADWREAGELLRTALISPGPVAMAGILGELRETIGREARMAVAPTVVIDAGVAAARASPATAWAVVAAVIEMAEEGRRWAPASISLHLQDDRLVALVRWVQDPRRGRRADASGSRRNEGLREIGALLRATVVRIRRGRERGVALVVDAAYLVSGPPA